MTDHAPLAATVERVTLHADPRGLVFGPLAPHAIPAQRDVHVPEREACRLVIPPGVSHAFRADGDTPMLLVGFNTEPHDPAAPDIVRDLLIAPPS